MNREHIIRLIEDAFADVRKPAGELTVGETSDAMDVEHHFSNCSWRDLFEQMSPEILLRNCEGWHAMTPKAYHYFLPGFMIAGLSDRYGATDVLASIMYSFLPRYDGNELRENIKQRISLLSDAQLGAVMRLFEFVREHSDEFATSLEDIDAAVSFLYTLSAV